MNLLPYFRKEKSNTRNSIKTHLDQLDTDIKVLKFSKETKRVQLTIIKDKCKEFNLKIGNYNGNTTKTYNSSNKIGKYKNYILLLVLLIICVGFLYWSI